MNAKYIVIEFSIAMPEAILIFPEDIPHRDFANGLGHSRRIISAGFILLRNGEFICHDQSISLGIKSRPAQDSVLANMMFGRI